MLTAFEALYAAACVERDAAAAAALFLDEPGISFSGSDLEEHATTRAGLLKILTLVAASPGSLRFHWSERQVHITGDTAWVNAAGSVAISGPDGQRTIPYRVTAVLLRRDGRWLWHTHAGSSPDGDQQTRR